MRVLRFARLQAAMAILGAGATLLAACTFTPWQSSLGRPGDDSGADAAAAASDAAAPSSAEVTASAVPSATSIVVPTSRVAADASTAGAAKDLYRVKAGDTLYRIAAAHGQRAADIAAWNKLPASGQVNVGQMLRVAPLVKGAATASAPASTPAPVASVASEPASKAPAAKPRPAAARFVWPMNGSIAIGFGSGKSRGIVIAGAPGEPVKAAAAGRVTYVGSGIQGYGKLIIVKHSARLLTAYGRNGRLLVKQGDTVKPGQTIATSGADSAGVGTLLFEVRESGKPVDPMDWLPRPQS